MSAKNTPAPAARARAEENVRPPVPHLFLYITAAITGAAVMVGQMLGAKMLSPFFGLSHFVWTAQIAVTLVALTFGYYLGGRLAGSVRPGLLYWGVFGAAVWLALTVVICEPVSYNFLGTENSNLAVGSLLTTVVLFFPPLLLLAMAVPFLVRMLTSSINGLGANVGRLSFISTLGSFVGTLVIAYFMVPRLPNTVSVLVIALVLAGMSAAYFIMRRQFGAVSVMALFAVVAGFAISLETSANSHFRYVKELFRGNSHFGRLQVVERLDGSTRYYMNDNLIQNTYDPQLQQSESAFTFMLSGMARAYVTNIEDVLCIGMGVGIVPMDFAKSGARVDLVEINPAVVPVATKFFNFDVSKVNLTIDDGRHFLNRCKKQYDVVVLDAFLGDSSPTHLMTREAFESMRRVLRPGGALVINAFCELEPGRDFFATSLNRTLKSVFSGVRMHTKGSGAIFFTATPRPDPQFVRPPDIAVVHPRVQNEVEGIFNNLADTDPKSGLILTDDYNPAEYYDARNRELIRRHLARGAREM